MHAWMEIVFFNAVAATVLALPIALVGRRFGRPALLHALWLLVLLRLIAPPAFEFGFVPRGETLPKLLSQSSPARTLDAATALDGAYGAHAVATPAQRGLSAEGSQQVAPPSETRGLLSATRPSGDRSETAARILDLAFLLAAAGTLFFLVLSLIRLVRFRRHLRGVSAASPALQRRLTGLAETFGIKRAPHIRVVTARIPPSLRPGPGRCEILIPEGLLTRLHEDELDAILAHELAHVRRHDHWIRPLELLIVALYWWHPVAWWARRHLRGAEEQACDAMVLSVLKCRSRIYARSLLKTVEFLTPYEPGVPLLATGATGTAHLKERIKMILKKNSSKPMPAFVRPVLYAVLPLLLLVSPGWAERPAETQKPPETQAKANPEQKHQQELLTIQQKQVQLQRQLEQLERERQSIQLKIDQKRTQQQLEQMREMLEALKKDGRKAEAEKLEQQIDSAELEADLHRKKVEAELADTEERAQIEYKLQDLQMEVQKAQLANDQKRVQELTGESFALQQELQRLELKTMQAELERNRARLEHEKQQLEEMEQ